MRCCRCRKVWSATCDFTAHFWRLGFLGWFHMLQCNFLVANSTSSPNVHYRKWFANMHLWAECDSRRFEWSGTLSSLLSSAGYAYTSRLVLQSFSFMRGMDIYRRRFWGPPTPQTEIGYEYSVKKVTTFIAGTKQIILDLLNHCQDSLFYKWGHWFWAVSQHHFLKFYPPSLSKEISM